MTSSSPTTPSRTGTSPTALAGAGEDRSAHLTPPDDVRALCVTTGNVLTPRRW